MYFTCVNTVRVGISIKSSGHNFKTFIGKKKFPRNPIMSSSQRAVAATTEPQPADLACLLKRLPTLRNIYTGDLNTDMLNIYITKKSNLIMF